MVVYELYWLKPTGEYQLIGVLPERRKNTMRMTRDSVINWAKMLLGHDVDCKNIFFERLILDRLADRILWHDLSSNSIKFIN